MKNCLLPLSFTALVLSSGTSESALIHHWAMDETSGGTAVDSAGSNHGTWQDGVSNNLTWEAGKIGNAAHLNDAGGGRIQNFNVGVLSTLAGKDQISISMWVNPDGQTDYNGLFATRTESSTGSWSLAWEGGNHIDFHTSGAGNQLDSANGITTGAWWHVLAVWDNATGNRAVYINGDAAGTGLSTSDTFTGGTNFAGDGSWDIGSDDCCSDRDFDGLIDDVGVFDTALTAADAKLIFDAGNAGINVAAALVPEPGSAVLALIGGLMGMRRRRS